MYTVYITPEKRLFISDFKNDLLNQNDLKDERKKLIYEPQNCELKIITLNPSLSADIPRDKNHTPVFQVAIKLTLDSATLYKAIKERREDLDNSWEEYFSIGRLLTPYTTEGLAVPSEVRNEVNRRLNLLKKNKPKELVDRLLTN